MGRPGPLPGRSPEVPGNRHPRGMTVILPRGRGQDPAYVPSGAGSAREGGAGFISEDIYP